VFVYVDETRPRNQGAKLTAWELFNNGIPHVIIPDNAAASLMAQGKIDMVIVGADRIAANGDVANKIGTLDRAIIAKEYNIPFYVAAPTSTIDIVCTTGKEIPIEERKPEEVLFQTGIDSNNNYVQIRVSSPGSQALNLAFDITPSKYITGIITEKGIIKAHHQSIKTNGRIIKFITMYSYKYPRPALTVDILITRKTNTGLKILLIQRLNAPFKDNWALPGGFVDMGESLEQAAGRELAEETGLTNIKLEQFKAFSTPDRDPRGHTISVVFTGLLTSDLKVTAGDDAKNVNWFNVNNLPVLAFDHKEIISEALKNHLG